MSESQQQNENSRPARRHRKVRSRRSKLLRAGAFTAAGLVLVGGGAAGYAYWKLNGNIKSVDIDAQLGTNRPSAPSDGSFNVLVLGSDSRAGSNSSLAGGNTDGTARSDTAMVVHVAQDHKSATVVSIPRDTLVSRPACTAKNGSTVPATKSVMYNSAFETGGAACAVKTTEQLTGMRMNHFVEIDFSGFASFIDAIGGATVTTTVNIHDKESGLNLPAGTNHLNGTQALAFVRTRHGVGDGSDLGRIELQKQMVKSIVKQVSSIGLFGNPVKLYSVGDTLTKSITTDSALASVSALTGLGEELKAIGTDQLTMVTLPVVPAPTDLNRVVAKAPDADQLWAALRADRPAPAQVVSSQPANPANPADPTASAGPSAAPSPAPGATRSR
ncbi:LCP family protein required for cell wall assembly [Kitasatospora sp. GP30]|uniref:LCP family protein n=1 Tax=Kitasatospora sp. GP30 TaxID=3035084 RepID=UPI000C703F50|nr:LCP family protein [Kitasatospora sp. GP30]MDH6143361.1 LCP family protein required for cell wall assembly [Kitasatospora sp. GP30]